MTKTVKINNTEYEFDEFGVLDRWFGFIICKRKYMYIYSIDTPELESKIDIETDKTPVFMHYSKMDLIDNVPAFMYCDLYRLKKRFKYVKVINNNFRIKPAIKIRMNIQKGSIKLTPYCKVFCCLTYKTPVTPTKATDEYIEFMLYDNICPEHIVVNDLLVTDQKAVYIAMVFVSAQIQKRVYHVFDIRKGKQFVFFKC